MPFDFTLLYLILIFLIIALLYVYYAYTWSIIAKKLKYKKHWLAWIPIAQMFLLPILAKKKWFLGFILIAPLLVLPLLSYAVFSWLILLLGIVNIFFTVWWTWIIFEKRNYPGYLSLIHILLIIPFIDFIAIIGYLIIIGFVAFKDLKKK